MKIVTSKQMRELEERCEERGITPDMLMENAGFAVFQKAHDELTTMRDKKVVVLVGPGNNGGDGLVVARHTAKAGADTQVYVCAERKQPDLKLDMLEGTGVTIYPAWEGRYDETLKDLLGKADLVIDAILGTGQNRALDGKIKDICAELNAIRAARPEMRVIALDIPTGLNADTGNADASTVKADVTVALQFPKAGLLTMPGGEFTGRLDTVDIGVPIELANDINIESITPDLVRFLLPKRSAGAHKGTFGKTLIIAGSANYIGAAYLAASGAARAGAGLVTLAIPQSLVIPVATNAPEITYIPLREKAFGRITETAAAEILEYARDYDAIVIGCGLGKSPEIALMINSLLKSELLKKANGIVVDADALNNLAVQSGWPESLPANCVLTPHAGEMGRLTGKTPADVQARRVELAREASINWKQVAALKGAFTAVADPAGAVRINPFANAAMATAGTGDVLAGIIGGLMSQGLRPYDAACAGVYIHALAGEMASRATGDAGMLASDLLSRIPRAMQSIKRL